MRVLPRRLAVAFFSFACVLIVLYVELVKDKCLPEMYLEECRHVFHQWQNCEPLMFFLGQTEEAHCLKKTKSSAGTVPIHFGWLLGPHIF
jgi:hypothetical protein